MLTTPRRPERKILETKTTPDGVILKSEYGCLRLQAYDRGILRVTFTRDASFPAATPFLMSRMYPPIACVPAYQKKKGFWKPSIRTENRYSLRVGSGRWRLLTPASSTGIALPSPSRWKPPTV